MRLTQWKIKPKNSVGANINFTRWLPEMMNSDESKTTRPWLRAVTAELTDELIAGKVSVHWGRAWEARQDSI